MSDRPETPGKKGAAKSAGATRPITPPWISIDENLPASAPPVLARHRRAVLVAALEAAVFLAGLLAGILVSGGGGKKEPGASQPGPDPAPAPAGPAPSAPRALEEARAFARENPQDLKGQAERFLRVARDWEKTPVAEKARREAESVPARWKIRLLDEIVDLEARSADHEAREEFRDALGILDKARDRYADPSWGQALSAKADDIRRRVDALYLALKPAAEKAAAGKDDVELGKIRERIELWGLEDIAREFDRAFAGAVPPPSPAAPEAKSYLDLWGKAAALAAVRDYDAAAALVKRAARTLPTEDLRLDAGTDLEDIRRVAALYDDVRQALARWPRGGGVALETSGGARKVSGTVCHSDRDRFEIQTGPGKDTVFVEYSDIAAASLVELHQGRARGAVRDARAQALFLLLDGDARGGEETVPEKYRAFAREGRARAARPDSVELRNERQARDLYVAAEREYRAPQTRSLAVEKYRALLRDYMDVGLVLRAAERIARRAEPRNEYYYAASDLWTGGTFRLRKQASKGPCWGTEEETEFARARENFVEVEFAVAGNAQPRCWFQVGGCCQESFSAFYQVSDLTTANARKPGAAVHVEPGSVYALTLAAPAWPRKGHAAHGSGDPLQWEWIEIPLPKYAAAGTKRARLMTSRRGLHVARAVVSAARKAPPKEDEIRDLEEARAADLGFLAGADPDLLGAWSLDEGTGKVLGDASGNGHLGAVSGDPAWGEGKQDLALAFDGKEDSVQVQDSPKLRIAGDLTIAFWVRYESEAKVRHRLAGKGEESYGVWGSTGNKLLFQQCDAGGRQVLGVTSRKGLAAGRWHHVAAVVKGERGYLYVDGAEEGAADRAGTPAASADPLSLGYAGRDGYFAGMLDEVRLYGRALSPDEIRTLAGK